MIPGNEMAEHIRIELLDPRWREQKERSDRDRASGGEPYVGGATALVELRLLRLPSRYCKDPAL